MLDVRGVIREINRAGAAFLGKPRHSLPGRSLLSMVAPPDRRKLRQHLQRSRAQPGDVSTEIVLRRAAGQESVVEVTSKQVVGPDGEKRVLTVLVDLSRERHATRNREQERILLESTLRQAPDSVIICDRQGRLVLVNPPAERLVGRGVEGQAIAHVFAASGRLFDADGSFVPPERWPLSVAVRGETTADRDFRLVRPDGVMVDLRFSATPVRDGEGRITAAIATAIDFSERKWAEQQRMEIAQRLDALLKALPVGVAFSDDPSCRRVTGNPTLCAQFDVEPTDNVSASAADAAAPGRRVQYWRNGQEVGAAELPLQRAVAESQVIPPMELEVELPSGRRWVSDVSGAPILDAQGRVAGGVAVTVDVTERKRVEGSLAQRRAWDEARAAIGAAAVSGKSLAFILTSCLDAVAHAVGVPVGLIRLVDPVTRDLVLAAQRGVSPTSRHVVGRIKWGVFLAGRVAEAGSGHVIEDTSVEPGLPLLEAVSDPPPGSLVCVPLKSDRQVLGTLTLGHPQVRGVGATDMVELLPCAHMIAGAIWADQLRVSLRREADERTLLLHELDHRVRNTLATLIGLLHLTAENQPAPTAAILQATADRVSRLADVHTALAEHRHGSADLGHLAKTVAKSILDLTVPPGRVQWDVVAPPIALRASQATNVALVLHELLTNCGKHAFVGRATGTISVEVRRDGEMVGIGVYDDGRGPGPDGFRAGAGFGIVEALVLHTLRGAFWVAEARGGGTLVYVRFPLDERTPSGEPP